jgi:hypothetical protein
MPGPERKILRLPFSRFVIGVFAAPSTTVTLIVPVAEPIVAVPVPAEPTSIEVTPAGGVALPSPISEPPEAASCQADHLGL